MVTSSDTISKYRPTGPFQLLWRVPGGIWGLCGQSSQAGAELSELPKVVLSEQLSCHGSHRYIPPGTPRWLVLAEWAVRQPMGTHFTGPGPGEIVVKLASNPQTTKTADFSSTASGRSQISQGVFSISSGGTPGQLPGSLGVPRMPPNSGCQALGSCMTPSCPFSVCPSC